MAKLTRTNIIKQHKSDTNNGKIYQSIYGKESASPQKKLLYQQI